MLLIGVMVGIGCFQVAQRNAILVKSYAVSERTHRLQAKRNEVAWLQAQVEGISSPTHLAQVAEERRLKLVAWSRLPPTPSLVSLAPEREDVPSNE
jgi:hypothetical protein